MTPAEFQSGVEQKFLKWHLKKRELWFYWTPLSFFICWIGFKTKCKLVTDWCWQVLTSSLLRSRRLEWRLHVRPWKIWQVASPWPRLSRKCMFLFHNIKVLWNTASLLIPVLRYRDVVYFNDTWISRIKPEVGDNWRLKVTFRCFSCVVT